MIRVRGVTYSENVKLKTLQDLVGGYDEKEASTESVEKRGHSFIIGAMCRNGAVTGNSKELHVNYQSLL